MTFTVLLRPEAENDLLEAAKWYEEQQSGLGHQFLDEVRALLSVVAKNPSMYPLLHRSTRRALIQQFPFGIFYRVEDNKVIVIGNHARQ